MRESGYLIVVGERGVAVAAGVHVGAAHGAGVVARRLEVQRRHAGRHAGRRDGGADVAGQLGAVPARARPARAALRDHITLHLIHCVRRYLRVVGSLYNI